MRKLKVSYLPHPILSVEERHQYLPEILLTEFDTSIFNRSKDALSQPVSYTHLTLPTTPYV